MRAQGVAAAYPGDARVHALFVALGVLAAGLVVVRESRRRGLWGEEMLVAVTGALVGGAIGMRASSVLRDPGAIAEVGWTAIWQDGAKSILGGLTGAYLGVVLAKRLIGYRQPTGDVFAPAVALGMAIGRFGCLLTEPPGRPAAVPWGVVPAGPDGGVPGCIASCAPGLALHPSFGYEIAFHAAAFVVLLALRERITTPGALLTLYLAAYAVFRFLVEFTRDNEVIWQGLTRGQIFVAVLVPLLAWRVVVLVGAERGTRERDTRPGTTAVTATEGPA